VDNTNSTAALQRLLGVSKPALTELAARGIVQRGERRGTYRLKALVTGYCAHLREQASARGCAAGVSNASGRRKRT
jgi:hypothetical protein